jgi:hypothetical protein
MTSPTRMDPTYHHGSFSNKVDMACSFAVQRRCGRLILIRKDCGSTITTTKVNSGIALPLRKCENGLHSNPLRGTTKASTCGNGWKDSARIRHQWEHQWNSLPVGEGRAVHSNPQCGDSSKASTEIRSFAEMGPSVSLSVESRRCNVRCASYPGTSSESSAHGSPVTDAKTVVFTRYTRDKRKLAASQTSKSSKPWQLTPSGPSN